MPNTYIFQPLLDSEGKQVVRQPKEGEWYRGKTFDQPIMCHGLALAEENRPILTLKKFDHDPFEGLREIYKHLPNAYTHNFPTWHDMAKAISDFIKELEGE